MKAGYMGPIALVLVLVGCGDDDGASMSNPTNPFGNAAAGGSDDVSSSGVNKGAGTTGSTVGSAGGTTANTGGTSASAAGTSAGPQMPGPMSDGGMMKPPMMKGEMKPPMMEGMMPGVMEEMPALVCPATAPVNATPCTAGRGTCTFGTLKCRCKKEGWSCETAPVMPPADGGMPMP